MLRTVFNVGEQPVPIDDEGHMIGGREYGSADPDAVRALIDAGTLVVVEESDAKNISDEARAAIKATAQANKTANTEEG